MAMIYEIGFELMSAFLASPAVSVLSRVRTALWVKDAMLDLL